MSVSMTIIRTEFKDVIDAEINYGFRYFGEYTEGYVNRMSIEDMRLPVIDFLNKAINECPELRAAIGELLDSARVMDPTASAFIYLDADEIEVSQKEDGTLSFKNISENNVLTYRELLRMLQSWSPERLDNHVSVYNNGEFHELSGASIADPDNEASGILDPGHPFLRIA